MCLIAALLLLTTAPAEVCFRRIVSTDCVAAGDTATVVYCVSNDERTAITDILVEDTLGAFSAALESIAPNSEAAAINIVVPEEASISQAQLTYTDGSGETHTIALADAEIGIGHLAMSATLLVRAVEFTNEKLEAILVLSNDGDVDYSDLAVYDENGYLIADHIDLPAGSENVTVRHIYPLRESASYSWNIRGKDGAGHTVDVHTAAVAYEDDRSEEVLLTMSAGTTMPSIKRKGYVPFTLKLNNLCERSVGNVVISEEALGDLQILAAVPTNNGIEVVQRLWVDETTTYRFSATYRDAEGNERTARAEDVTVTIAASGVEPEWDENRAGFFDRLQARLGDSALFLVLLCGALVVLIVLMTVFIVIKLRHRRSKKAAKKESGKKD